jgi:hypothetical protein
VAPIPGSTIPARLNVAACSSSGLLLEQNVLRCGRGHPRDGRHAVRSELSAGHRIDEVRESAQRIAQQLPEARLEYLTRQTDGEYAFLEWRAESATCRVDDGADSYVIRGGRIAMQTIHYTLIPQGRSAALHDLRTAG